MKEGDEWKAAFWTSHRLFEPLVCRAGTYSAQWKVIWTLRLMVSRFEVTTVVEVGRKRN